MSIEIVPLDEDLSARADVEAVPFDSSSANALGDEFLHEKTMYEVSPAFKMSEYPTKPPMGWYRQIVRSLWWRSFANKVFWALRNRYYSYYWRHLVAWILIALIMSGPVYATGRSKDMPYIDALYYVTSAVTAAGLATRDLQQENVGTQIILIFCMAIGGAVIESALPLFVRLWHIRKERLASPGDEARLAALESDRSISIILLMIIFSYYFLSQIIVFVIMGCYFQFSEVGHETIIQQGTNSWWTSIYGTVSAFNNCGLFIFGASFIPFNSQITPLIIYGALILMGNTMYPIFLRMFVRLFAFALGRISALKTQAELLQILLDQPRSFLTHLFSSNHTWRLLVLQIALISLQTILLAALPQGNAFAGLSGGYQFANAIFQSIAVRTAGVASIPIGALSVEALSIMIVMMYVAAYPIIASLRSSNELQHKPKQTLQFQLQRLLLQDLMWVIFPWFLITACEGYFDYKPGFSSLFEVVAAYGALVCRWA